MLAKIAPRFVISRVIQNAYHAENMSVELLKQPFGTHVDYFAIFDAHRYYVLLCTNSVMQVLRIHLHFNSPHWIHKPIWSRNL